MEMHHRHYCLQVLILAKTNKKDLRRPAHRIEENRARLDSLPRITLWLGLWQMNKKNLWQTSIG